MAALLRRAASPLIAARSRGSSSLISFATCSPGSFSSSVTRSLECSNVHFRNPLFASSFLPFSASSAYSPHDAKFRKLKEKDQLLAAPEKSNKVNAEFTKAGRLTLYWESSDEIIEIQAEDKLHDQEHILQMHIKFHFCDDFSKHMEFDVALPDDQGQVAIQNARMSDDDYLRERFQVLLKCFADFKEKRGFNQIKFDLVVKCAEKLKEFRKCIESDAESIKPEFPNTGTLTLKWESKDKIIEIEVEEKIHDDCSETNGEDQGLLMRTRFKDGDKFCNHMEFDIALPDEEGPIAIQSVTMRVDDSEKYSGVHLNKCTGWLKKRGFNDSTLNFVAKYAEELKEIRKSLNLPLW